jgi:energy-coupling factor transporter ATP-binding protein EcfA2
MIFISRPESPEYLQSAQVVKANNQLRNFYVHKGQKRVTFEPSVLSPLKSIISDLFQHKCAFCESSAHAPVYGGVDHFRPVRGVKSGALYLKDYYYWLAYEWNNLYLVCNVCNRYRRDAFPLVTEKTRSPINGGVIDIANELPLLINPCQDNPSDHLYFEQNGYVKGKTDRGAATLEIFGLNRSDLAESRKNAIDSFWFFCTESNRLDDVTISDEVTSFIVDLFGDRPRQGYVAALRDAFKVWLKEYPAMFTRLYDRSEAMMQIIDQYREESEVFFDPGILLDPPVVSHYSYPRTFTIKKIQISNFKNIGALELDIEPTSDVEGKESWLLLLGDNGIGKSSILQAIAMTLCGSKELAELPVKAADVLKHGTENGFVKIWSFEYDMPCTLEYNQVEFSSQRADCPTSVSAYGATRLLPKNNLQPFINENPKVNIRNLFDYTIALTDVSAWLSKTNLEELNDRIIPALFDLLDLGKDYSISMEKQQLYIFDGEMAHSLETISDGYKAVVALACDIMKSLSTETSGYHATQGIVLIDELGNHLHPRWRMKIVSALRRTFPQLQFIVSTHEPLCLRGLLHGEVAVLMKDAKHHLRLLDKKYLPDHNLLRVDQLLTSDLFGLISTLDDDTNKKFEEYYALLSKPKEVRTDEELAKIKEYTISLADKENIGNTPQDQILYKIVNETYANKLKEEGFKTTEQLKEETISAVRLLIANQKLDWI